MVDSSGIHDGEYALALHEAFPELLATIERYEGAFRDITPVNVEACCACRSNYEIAQAALSGEDK